MINDEMERNQVFKIYTEGGYGEAIEGLKDLASRDDGDAMVALGWIYEVGCDTDVDNRISLEFYKKAVDLGFSEGVYGTSRQFLRLGKRKLAIPYLEKGVEEGHIPSHYWLGRIFLEDIGDPENGWSHLEIAAKKGHVWAKRKIWSKDWGKAKSLKSKLSLLISLINISFYSVKLLSSRKNYDRYS
ncbi:MAG: hypothetical protein ABJP48_07010 [Erythrobacter sp.]